MSTGGRPEHGEHIGRRTEPVTGTEHDIEAVAIAFDPTSDYAWAAAFPDDPIVSMWQAITGASSLVAAAWSQHFSPLNANPWVAADFTPDQAVRWDPTGMRPIPLVTLGWRAEDPAEVFAPWEAAGIEPGHIELWVSAGVSSSEHAALFATADRVYDSLRYDPMADRIQLIAVDYLNDGWTADRLAEHVRTHQALPELQGWRDARHESPG